MSTATTTERQPDPRGFASLDASEHYLDCTVKHRPVNIAIPRRHTLHKGGAVQVLRIDEPIRHGADRLPEPDHVPGAGDVALKFAQPSGRHLRGRSGENLDPVSKLDERLPKPRDISLGIFPDCPNAPGVLLR
jgi:hypothetical protein